MPLRRWINALAITKAQAPEHCTSIHKRSLRPDPLDSPVKLEDLPTEIIYQICDLLSIDDLKALRLTNRGVSSKATTPNFTSLCHVGRCQLDDEFLLNARALTQSGGLGCLVEFLNIVGIGVAAKHRVSLWNLNAWRKAKRDNKLLDEKMLACRQLEASSRTIAALRDCLDTLGRNERCCMTIQIIAETFDVLEGVQKYTHTPCGRHDTPVSIHETATYAFETVMPALLDCRSLRLTILSIADPVMLECFDKFDWRANEVTGLSFVKVLRLCFTTNRPFLNAALGMNSVGADGCHGLHKFISSPKALHHLQIEHSIVNLHDSRHAWAPDPVFLSLTGLQNWAAPATCRIYKLEIPIGAMLHFVAHCPLKDLYLDTVNLITTAPDQDDNAWGMLLRHPRFLESSIWAVKFCNVFVNGSLENIWGEFVRCAGPLSNFEQEPRILL
jgi:hypothetical protein